jgi:hypothetical protein
MVKHLKIKTIFYLSAILLLNTLTYAQKTAYIQKVDSIISSNKQKLDRQKRFRTDSSKLQVSINKYDSRINSIVQFSKNPYRLIIYYYQDDKLIMIWPKGLEPYYIFNDKLEYSANELDESYLRRLIENGNWYLNLGYDKFFRKK